MSGYFKKGLDDFTLPEKLIFDRLSSKMHVWQKSPNAGCFMKGTGCSFDVVGMIHRYPYATIGDTVSFDGFFWGCLAKRSPIQVRSVVAIPLGV